MPESRIAPPPAPATPEDRLELWDDITDVKIGMLTTFDRDGELTARPVSVVHIEPNGTLWFFTAIDGGIAEDIKRDSRVHMSFVDRADDVYVSLRGRASVFQDPAKAKEIWSSFAGAWFPEGPDDPNLGLLRIDVERGDYWDVKSSKLVQFFALAKATLTGTPPDETGRHKQFIT